MNTEQNTPDQPAGDQPGGPVHDERSVPAGGDRPFGFWLKVIDRRLSDEMEALFASDGITRRDWRVLNLLAGDARDEHLAARLGAKPHALHRLAERGWVDGFPPEVTDAGREARDRLAEQVSALRERVAGTVSPEDFATTLRSLEAIATELGWDESQPLPRGRRGGRRHGFGGWHGAGVGHGAGTGHGFGRGHGFGHHPGFRPQAGHQDVHVHVHLHDDDRRHDRGHGRHDRPHTEH